MRNHVIRQMQEDYELHMTPEQREKWDRYCQALSKRRAQARGSRRGVQPPMANAKDGL